VSRPSSIHRCSVGVSVTEIFSMALSPCPPAGSACNVPAYGDAFYGAQPVAEKGDTRSGEQRQGAGANVPIRKSWENANFLVRSQVTKAAYNCMYGSWFAAFSVSTS